MNTEELIEIARDCKGVVIEQDNVYQADAGEIHFFCADDLQQFAQRIEQPHLQRIAELELALQKQAKAALHGMDAAKTSATAMLKVATETQSQLNPELIESERQANAVLTEENERLQQQIEQLREALQDALRYKRADEKLVDIINGVGQQQQKPKHGRQA